MHTHIHSPTYTYIHTCPHKTPSGTLTHAHIYMVIHTEPSTLHTYPTHIYALCTHTHTCLYMYTLTHIHLTHIHTHSHTSTFARHSYTHTDNLPHTPFSQAASHWWVCQGWNMKGASGWGVFGEGAGGGEATVRTVGLGEAGCGNLQAFGRRPGPRDD